ncbi:phage portal protein [Macrococcus capreoli]|uniref:phage portal protein n=1 Tax=Macrococcus capreoli TaxID=2982690 RepID=UPI0021D5CE0C|nr:phage portal protein [Macrococcus sp. TMW 2.2395]MCU7557263.1 phage portal protein [Macrococcus sp. TMW 2.2395]
MNFFSKNQKRDLTIIKDNISSFLEVITTSDWNEIDFVGIDALQNSDVLTAVHMISSDIAGLKLTSIESERDKDLLNLLNIRPNNFMSAYNLKYAIVANLILDGNVFVEITRNEAGRAIQLDLIPHANVKVIITKNPNHIQEVKYQVRNYSTTNDNETRVVLSKDMLHFKMLSTDGVVGRSPLRSLKADLNINKSSKDFLDNFFRNGTHAGGILTAKGESLSPESKLEVKNEWQKANAGLHNSSSVVVLDDDFEYKPISIDTELIKVVHTSNTSKSAVAQVTGIPLHKFGISTSNLDLSQLNQDYLISTLKSYLDVITSELYKLDSNILIELEFNVDEYKNIDTKQLHENVKIQRELGLISVDEARAKLGYKQLNNDIGAKFVTNLNYVNSDIVDEYQLNKASNKKGGDN